MDLERWRHTSHDPLRLRSFETAVPLLSIIIPVYNEQATVSEILRRILQTGLAETAHIEIIVVDDGSVDSSWMEICHWTRDSRIKRLRHGANQGKGAAIQTALHHVTGLFVVIQDADLEYDPRDLEPMLHRIARTRNQAVYGSRYVARHDENWTTNRPSWMSVGVRVLNWAVYVLYGVRTTDVCTCYKMMPTSLLRSAHLEATGFDFCAEVTAKLSRLGVAINEVAISYAPRSVAEGKKISWRDGLRLLRALWRYRRWTPPDASWSADSVHASNIHNRIGDSARHFQHGTVKEE